MKHITMGEINKFQCVGSQCPYTCCAGWRITVDEETDSYYQSVEGEFGEELKKSINRKSDPAIMELRNGRCAFLNDENLCRIYIELGPEHMCETCKVYPRIRYLAGDAYFHYMTISCPEVGRIFLSRRKPIEIHVMEDDKPRLNYPVKSSDWTFFQRASRAFHINASILQNRAHSVTERERVFLLFNRALQDALDAGKCDDAEKLIAFFSAPENYASLAHGGAAVQLSSKVRLFRELCELFLTKKQDFAVVWMFAGAINYIRAEDRDISQLSDALEASNGKEFQREDENLLIYLLFSHYLSDDLLDKSANRNLFRRAVFILTVYQFYRIFKVILSIDEKQPMELQKRALVISSLSRYFEHDQSNFVEKFNDTLEKRNFYDLGFLFQLIT